MILCKQLYIAQLAHIIYHYMCWYYIYH